MAKRNSTVKIENGKVVLSQEIIDYFENLRNEENSEWIDKYFNVLGDENNLSATKYRKHHIIPCFVFKDENHKNRLETQSLANAINNNKIKLSFVNHIMAHYFLWKIFPENHDARMAVYVSIGTTDEDFDNLTENEIIKIAEILQECSKENVTDEEKKIYQKIYAKEYYKNHQEKLKARSKKRYDENREQILKQQREYNKENKEQISKRKKKYTDSHKKEKALYDKNYNKIHKKERSEKQKLRDNIPCFDPIKNDKCTYNALYLRKRNHKEDYGNVNPKDCIIKSE